MSYVVTTASMAAIDLLNIIKAWDSQPLVNNNIHDGQSHRYRSNAYGHKLSDSLASAWKWLTWWDLRAEASVQ